MIIFHLLLFFSLVFDLISHFAESTDSHAEYQSIAIMANEQEKMCNKLLRCLMNTSG